ncbi:MAG: T9SS type A sorting domain-containing protein [Candidatus Marinimicrobia bacterium]|nr:T9SS type A sorting domain-containing protein [Candidatus Neomarinimicrobiota bacterium]
MTNRLLLFFLSVTVFAQIYDGGSGDGYCSISNSGQLFSGNGLYAGGFEDGYNSIVYSSQLFSGIGLYAGGFNDGYSSAVIAGGDQSLPVVLTTFTSDNSRLNQITLIWITESEIENLGFILERRNTELELLDWVEIATYLTNKALAGQGSSTDRSEYIYVDELIEPGMSYEYRLADVSYDGELEYHTMTVLVTAPALALPKEYTLQQNFPNPFNPTTTIRYEIPKASRLELVIYDVRGAVILQYYYHSQPAGWYELEWAGISDNGYAVNTGVYFCRLQAGSFSQIIKMVYLR